MGGRVHFIRNEYAKNECGRERNWRADQQGSSSNRHSKAKHAPAARQDAFGEEAPWLAMVPDRVANNRPHQWPTR